MKKIIKNSRSLASEDSAASPDQIALLKQQVSMLESQLNRIRDMQDSCCRNEELYTDIFNNVGEGILYASFAGKMLFVNKFIEDLVGKSKKEIIGKSAIVLANQILSGEALSKVLPAIKSLVSRKNVEPFEIEYKGRVLSVQTSINHRTKRLFATLHDITERRKNEIALQTSEMRLRRAELASRSGNWELHQDEKMIIGSAGARRLYGVTEPVIDYEIAKKIPLPEYRDMLDRALKELVEEGKPYNIEFKIRNITTGEIIDIHSVCEYDKEKRIIFGSIQDITDRKKAENEIKDKSRDLAKLLEISIELLETTDRRKVFEKIVRGVPGLIGVEAGAIYMVNGENLYLETSYPPLPTDMPEEIRKASLKNHPHIRKAVTEKSIVILKDSKTVSLTPEEKVITDARDLRSLIYIPLFANLQVVGAVIFGTIGFQHDFSEHEIDLCKTLSNMASLALENSLLVNNLTLAKEKAEESDRLKTAFLHNISHEIRTPLNAIIGFSGFLDQPDLGESERKEYVDIIFQSNNQLLSIINDILNISQIETNQVTLRESAVHINHILKNLHRQFKDDALRAGLDYRLNIPGEEEDPVMFTDESKLLQVLGNLLNNAFKFTHEGYVELGFSRKDGFAEFYVQDTGIGIHESEHDKIFDRFYQVDKKASRIYSGTGLGLSICRAYVQFLGGKIDLVSSPGNGSRFSIAIPWKGSSEADDLKDNDDLVSDNVMQERTILVAEDEESNYALVKAILKPVGYKVIRAKNGREAVEICRSNPEVGLILMDIKMPVMDGFEATREILKLRPRLPVVAQTAYAHPSDRARAIETGCCDYVSKPFSRDQLKEIIKKYLK